MTSASLAAVLRQVCGWAARYTDHNLPDHQLLERFSVGRDEAAFAALVRRHGGMVLSVARRILHDAHAAEDVFQNTFLTLARRAGSIRKRGSIASWLYGVAARLSSQMRMRDARRSAREREASPRPAAEDVTEAAAWRELGAVLDEELLCLPERYLAPLVLIYFVGQTQEEAARQLGWSKGTLRRRVERGKRLLHERLLRRGVSLSIGLLVGGVAQSAAKASLPLSLIRRTVEEAVRVASGEAALWVAGAASLTRAKIVLALGLLIAGGAGVAALHRGGEQPKAKQEENSKPPAHEAKRPRVDHFGDSLPEGVIARLGTMRLRHGNGTDVAFPPDGKSLMTCGTDLTIHAWDLATGRLLREQQLPRTGGNSFVVVLSPDGRYAAFEKRFGSVVLWDLRADKSWHEFPIQGGWPRILFSPDSKLLVIADEERIHIADVATCKGRSLDRLSKRRMDGLAFTANGSLLLLAEEKTLRLWNVKEGREASRLTLKERVLTAAISPDGRAVAITSYSDKDEDNSVRFWDTATGKPVKDWKDWDYPKGRPAPGVQFTPDGKSVLICTDEGILVWDPLAGKCVRTMSGRRGFNFTFSPDGKWAASLGGPVGSGFQIESMVQVWDLTTGRPHAANRPEIGHFKPTDGLVFSPDGCTLASTSQGEQSVRLWDAATGRPLRSLPVKERIVLDPLSFMPDGKELLLGTSTAIVRLEVAGGREVRRYAPGKKGNAAQYVVRMHLSDDGRTLLALSGHRNGQTLGFALHAWDTATGEPLRSVPLALPEHLRIGVGHSSPGCFSSDGRLLVIPDGSIRDTITGEELARLSIKNEPLQVPPVAFSLDGGLLAMGIQGKVRQGRLTSRTVTAIQVWETVTLAPVARLETGPVAHVAFTPDGRHLVSAGLDALTLWDIASGRAVAHRPAPGRFQGNYGPSFANCLAVAADGRTVATGNADTTILLWDLSPPAANRPAALLADVQREAYWTDLSGDDASRALVAIAHLADEPKQTVPLLRARLYPAKTPSAKELRRLLADLDHAQFERREAATKRLAELGELAQTALREALQRQPSLEVRRRIDNLLAASRQVHVPEERRHLRAVRILEAIGTREARQVLETLAQGAPNARLTKATKDAVARLARRTKP
ncbi:MAG TPA: sigma-70 family RNA polymerase sigma factor [Gemmataceae bacterium]